MSGWCVTFDDESAVNLYKLGDEPAVSMGTMAVWEASTKGAFDTLVRRFMTLEDVRAEEEVKEILFSEIGKQFAAAILNPWFRDLKDNARTDYIIAKFLGLQDASGQVLSIFAGEFSVRYDTLEDEYFGFLKKHMESLNQAADNGTFNNVASILYESVSRKNENTNGNDLYNFFFKKINPDDRPEKDSNPIITQVELNENDPEQCLFEIGATKTIGYTDNDENPINFFLAAYCFFEERYRRQNANLKEKNDFLLAILMPLTLKWIQRSKDILDKPIIYKLDNDLYEFPKEKKERYMDDKCTLGDPGSPVRILINDEEKQLTYLNTWTNMARGFFYKDFSFDKEKLNDDDGNLNEIQTKFTEAAKDFSKEVFYKKKDFEGFDNLWYAINNQRAHRWELISGSVAYDGTPQSFVKANSDRIWKEFKKMKEAGKKAFGVGRNLLDMPSFSGVAPFVSHWFESARLQAYVQKQREDYRTSKRRRTDRADFGEEYEEESYASNWPSERMHFSKMQRQIEVIEVAKLIALLLVSPSKDLKWYQNTESQRLAPEDFFKISAKRHFGAYTLEKTLLIDDDAKGVALSEHVVLQGTNIDCASLSLTDAFENISKVINLDEDSVHVKFSELTKEAFEQQFNYEKTLIASRGNSVSTVFNQKKEETYNNVEEFVLLPAANARPTHEVFVSKDYWVVGASPTLFTCAAKVVLNFVLDYKLTKKNWNAV